MMQAHASEAGAAMPHDVAFYLTPEFWVFVAFVIFIGLVARPAYRIVTAALDDRAETIRKKLDEAERLRIEAKDLLSTYQRKQREAAEEAERIVAHAQREAEHIRAQAVGDLENAIRRREAQAKERIAQVEARAVADVQATASDLALAAARRIITEQMTADSSARLIDDAIGELPSKLN